MRYSQRYDDDYVPRERGIGQMTRLLFPLAALIILLVLLLAAIPVIGAEITHFRDLTDLVASIFEWALRFLLVAGVVWLAIWLYYWWKAHPLPARQGRYPALINPAGEVTMLDDQQPRFEQVRSFSPRTVQTREVLPEIPEVIDADAEGAQNVEPLPFRTMYQEIRPDRLVFGYRPDGTPIYGTQRQLGSGCLVVGKPDTGKSTLARFWLASALVARWPAIVLDPHGSIAEEVGGSLACYESQAEIRDQARYLIGVLNARLALGQKAPHQPLLVLVDEWLWHLQHSPESALAVKRIVTEARKFGMTAMLFGHSYRSSEEMGREVLDNATSQYVLWTTSLQARMAGLEMTEENKELLARLRTAGQGKAILSIPRVAPELAGISDTTPQDIAMMVQMYGVPVLKDVPVMTRQEETAEREEDVSSLSSAKVVQMRPKQATPGERERERIREALLGHPDWSNMRIAQSLGWRNNNASTRVKAIREEMEAAQQELDG
jgi:hypothetical protein